MARKTLTFILLMFLVIIIAFAYKYYYPDINSNSVNMFIHNNQSTVEDKDNARFAIIGITAPGDVVDIHKYGQDLVNQSLAMYLDNEKKHISSEAKLPVQQNEIRKTFDSSKLNCWINDEPAREKCYSKDELAKIVLDNKILLDRYKYIMTYRKYDEGYISLTPRQQILIDLHKLFLASIKYSLQSNADLAFEELMRNLRFERSMLSQPGTWIQKAIWLVMYGMSIKQLEYAVANNSDIAQKNINQLNTILTDLSIEEVNLDGVFKKEFDIINSLFCIDEKLGIQTKKYCESRSNLVVVNANFVMNAYYNKYLEYKKSMNLNVSEMTLWCNKMKSTEYDYYFGIFLHLPIYKTYIPYSLMAAGADKACMMIISFKERSAILQLMRVFLSINGRFSNDRDINNYLQSTAESDSITGLPFIYDTKNKLLKFPDGVSDYLKNQTMKLQTSL